MCYSSVGHMWWQQHFESRVHKITISDRKLLQLWPWLSLDPPTDPWFRIVWSAQALGKHELGLAVAKEFGRYNRGQVMMKWNTVVHFVLSPQLRLRRIHHTQRYYHYTLSIALVMECTSTTYTSYTTHDTSHEQAQNTLIPRGLCWMFIMVGYQYRQRGLWGP